MAGAYCKFCGQRCFVLRTLPADAAGRHAGQTIHMATCGGGMEHDRKVCGHDHATAINPAIEAEVAKFAAAGGYGQPGMFDLYGRRLFDEAELSSIAAMFKPVRCTCGQVYDLGTVEVTARYADCSMWKAPCCDRVADDRGEFGWKSTKDYEVIDKTRLPIGRFRR